MARRQLLALGFTTGAIRHRLEKGRLHAVRSGIYAVGRPELTQHGKWMAAVLSCGTEAVLSDRSGAELWQLTSLRAHPVEVTVPSGVARRQRGIVVHRRALSPGEITRRDGIPVTTPVATLVDLASRLECGALEAAVNEADELDLVSPERLRAALDEAPRRPGVGVLRRVLDHRTFTLTDSELERRFLRLARRAGLPAPLTQQRVNGFRVDFHWPQLGLVVETDGLRYHRTPAQQAGDRSRDQAHAAAGLTPLRFTHAQVTFEPAHVEATLAAVARRLRAVSE